MSPIKQLIDENVESAMLAKDLENLYLNQSNAVRSYLLTGDESYLSQYEESSKKANDTIGLMMQAYKTEEIEKSLHNWRLFNCASMRL